MHEGPNPTAQLSNMVAKEFKPRVGLTMTVSPKNMHPLQTSHNDALVIQLKIVPTMIHWIVVDTESYIDIITLECLKKLQYSEKDLQPVESPIVDFGGHATYPLGTKRLPMRVGD